MGQSGKTPSLHKHQHHSVRVCASVLSLLARLFFPDPTQKNHKLGEAPLGLFKSGAISPTRVEHS